MKFTGQNIPSQLVAMFNKLVSPSSKLQGANGYSRTRRGATLPAKKKKPKQLLDSYQAAARLVVERCAAAGQKFDHDSRYSQVVEELKRSYFNPDYWTETAPESISYLQSLPTSVADLNPPPYQWRDPLKMPTIPTYPDGAASAGPERHSGAVTGGYQQDTYLIWSRQNFKLSKTFTAADNEPVYVVIDGNITASASNRGSRAMLSLSCKLWLVVDGNPILQTATPPLLKALAHYFRYEQPLGMAPYYNVTEHIRWVIDARVARYTDQAGTIARALLLLAPMPMMGRRYNNNTYVNTSLAMLAKCYQIKQFGHAIYGSSRIAGSNNEHAFRWTAAGGMVDLGTLGGNRSYAMAASSSTDACTGFSEHAGGAGYHAFRWTQADEMTDINNAAQASSQANGINADGSIICGTATNIGQSSSYAFIWSATGGMVDIGTLGGSFCAAMSLSDDGLTACGYGSLQGDAVFRSFIYTQATGIIDIGSLGGSNTTAQAISGNGQVIVGYSSTTGNAEQHAFRWTAAGGMQDLGTLGGSTSLALGCNADGSVIVGQSYITGNATMHAFRWTAAEGMQDLGVLSGITSQARAVSADGLEIVGQTQTAINNERHAFRWTAAGGMQDIGTLGGTRSVANAIG